VDLVVIGPPYQQLSRNMVLIFVTIIFGTQLVNKLQGIF